MIPEEAIISGFISKIINDLVDVTKDKIKKADRDRKSEEQSFETRIYQVIIDAVNEFTYGRYKNKDILYDAAENILNGFKNSENSNNFDIKSGLSTITSDVKNAECEKFFRVLCHEISRENNFDVYKEAVLISQQQEIEYNHNILHGIDKKLGNLAVNIFEKNKDFPQDDTFQNSNILQNVKSRTQEYADKWNENMFLNNFDKHDENAGVNVKLREVYIVAHLPHYIWKNNRYLNSDLKDFLFGYVNNKDKNSMLLVLGQPGIGKSTLITWITANFIDNINDILVYQFASDLGNVKWKDINEKYDLVDNILLNLHLSYLSLDGKTLIIDGLDEIRVENKIEILNKLYWKLIKKGSLTNFSLIVTCRENYIQELHKIECDYITLQAWDKKQIQSFCEIYQEKANIEISYNTVENILKNINILGIPLILYMVLGLNISVEKEGSIVDVYDKIFSLEDGGIYDRCLQNKRYEFPHRISEIKKQIYNISKEIAFWMFENKPVEAYIPKEEYKKICAFVLSDNKGIEDDILIGNYFKLVRYYEGIGAERLYFVHRSIYEYFVVETIYGAIKYPMLKLVEKSQEEFAGKVAFNLKRGRITENINTYLKYKIIKLYNNFNDEKKEKFYQWMESTVVKMMNIGMFYYTGRNIQEYENIIISESQCFLNLIKVLRILWHENKKEFILKDADRKMLERYIRLRLIECRMELPFGAEIINLSYFFLKNVDLSGEDLGSVNFSGANLERVNFRSAYLEAASFYNANLRRADLRNATLVNADLEKANLEGANLEASIWYEENIFNVLPQLKSAKFEYIIVEDKKQKIVYRRELFSEEN